MLLCYFQGSLATSKAQRQLRVVNLCRRGIELFVKQAWLDVVIVLVLAAGVLGNRTIDLMIENLADRNAGINSNRLNREHLQSPKTFEPNVAKPAVT